MVWYDIYFDETSSDVKKPVNHLDELKLIAEARREKQLDAPGEIIMAAAEESDESYDAPNFGIDKSAKNNEPSEDDGSEPAIIETEEELPKVDKKEEYVNISNPDDDEIYEMPKKPQTPHEQVQFAIDNIEKRSKYLDEPNVISDEAIDDILSSINFYD